LKTSLVFVMIALSTAARADSPPEEMRQGAESQDWEQCLMQYREALREGAKDETPTAALTKAVGALAVGATPKLKDLAAECVAQAKADPDSTRHWTDVVSLRASSIRSDALQLQQGESTDYRTILKESNVCSDAIANAIQVIDPKTPVVVGTYGQPDWKGAIADAQKWCDDGLKAGDAAAKKLLAPYVAAGIKGEKLDLLSRHLDVYFNLPGGATSDDPKKLAAAGVWFLVWSGDTCEGGKTISRVERFQFDGAQKLTSSTSKDYCGDAPAGAFH
jgi:hypothetical protein